MRIARERWRGLDQPVMVQYCALPFKAGADLRFRHELPLQRARPRPRKFRPALSRHPGSSPWSRPVIAIAIGVPLGVWAGARPKLVGWTISARSAASSASRCRTSGSASCWSCSCPGISTCLPSSGRNTFGLPQDPITGFLLLRQPPLIGTGRTFKDALAFILMPAFVLGVEHDGHPDAGPRARPCSRPCRRTSS